VIPGQGFAVDSKICSHERALADLIWGAILQRFPKLRFVLAEGGIGWVAAVLRSMDHWWEDHHHWMEPKVDEKPIIIFDRAFKCFWTPIFCIKE
jgi:predicted TIM-barrel fold metal-dependent hydrolase